MVDDGRQLFQFSERIQLPVRRNLPWWSEAWCHVSGSAR